MVYELELSKNAEKELNLLQKEISIRILDKLLEIKENPYRHIKRLVGSELFSLRVGDYRILMIIKDNKIFVVRIGHRKKVYD